MIRRLHSEPVVARSVRPGIARLALAVLILSAVLFDRASAAEASSARSPVAWRWTVGLAEGLVYLAYAVPDSDIRDIGFACDPRTGDVRIHPSLALAAEMDGLRVPLHLAAPAGALDVSALAAWNEVFLRIDLETSVPAAAVTGLLRGQGVLTVSAAGR